MASKRGQVVNEDGLVSHFLLLDTQYFLQPKYVRHNIAFHFLGFKFVAPLGSLQISLNWFKLTPIEEVKSQKHSRRPPLYGEMWSDGSSCSRHESLRLNPETELSLSNYTSEFLTQIDLTSTPDTQMF